MSLIKLNKERKVESNTKSRLGSLVTDPATSFQKSAFEIKETIKRPLTGLLRLPVSRGKARTGKDESTAKKPESEIANNSNFSTGSDVEKLPDVSTLEKVHSLGNKPALPVRLDAVNPKDAWMSKMGDVDLFLLSQYMCTENEVKEEMLPWSWDYLFACISMELREAYGLEDGQDDDK